MTDPDIAQQFQSRGTSAVGDSMKRSPRSTRDLSLLERCLLAAMRDLDFGRVEHLQIVRGKLVLDPRPILVRTVKFGSADAAAHKTVPEEFELKSQMVRFFEFVRTVDEGEIRCLVVRHGVPFRMEFEPRVRTGA